ncbi:MAG TPA: phage tail protein [Longimicrobium sp.]|nr:phage tail protein [Longimicrobium sp.]
MATTTNLNAGVNPYHNFPFVVSWGGQPVAGVSLVSGLARSTEPIGYREGADPIATPVSPGPSQPSPVTLERGVTHDQAFASWARNVWNGAAGTPPAGANIVRKDLYLALYNEAGQKVAGYNLYRCWPSAFETMDAFAASGSAVVIERLVLQMDGWERDASVIEPTPAYSLQ